MSASTTIQDQISETDAKNLAAVFYEALLIRRTSVGEALVLSGVEISEVRGKR